MENDLYNLALSHYKRGEYEEAFNILFKVSTEQECNASNKEYILLEECKKQISEQYYFLIINHIEHHEYKEAELLREEFLTKYDFDDRITLLAIPVNDTNNEQNILQHSESFKKEKILDIPLIDPTFLEYNGNRWLFGTTKEKTIDANSKLSIFIEKDGILIPHKSNPVVNDIHTARPGGKFFLYNGDLYRPAQSCEKMYGEHINLMKITSLTEDKYEEELVKSINSHNSKRFNLCLHTFNTYKNFAVVDGYEYSIQIKQRIKASFRLI